MNILFIHCRKGLYQLTKCKSCGHSFGCQNCDAKLVTYRQSDRSLELVCHQCQTYYKYPNQCPNCSSSEIYSRFGGIEELVEILQTQTEAKIIRLDKSEKLNIDKNRSEIDNQTYYKKNISICDRQEKNVLISSVLLEDVTENDTLFVHTRLFDPSVDYRNFDQIVFIQAENLLASADYLVAEETFKSLAEVLLQVDESTKVCFDTNSIELEIFQNLSQLHHENTEQTSVYQWYLNFLRDEKVNREKFGFPPFKNIILITTQEKAATASLEKQNAVVSYLNTIKMNIPLVSWSSPYPAKFLKRRNMFSHHLLVRFPRQYEHFNLLRREIMQLSEIYNLQVRLNPRHLF